MQENSEKYSAQDILRFAKSPSGQALLRLLQEQHPETVHSVVKSAKDGQMDKAGASLSDFLSDPKVQALLQRLQEEQNG